MVFNPDDYRKQLSEVWSKERASIGEIGQLGVPITLTHIQYYLTMDFLGARYDSDDSAIYQKKIILFREVTGIEVEWDQATEKLLLPAALDYLSEQVSRFNKIQS